MISGACAVWQCAGAGTDAAGKIRAGAASGFHCRRPVACGAFASCGAASCFPGSSITGAPKFRAMEIIDELEPVTRGPYTGSLAISGSIAKPVQHRHPPAIVREGQAHFRAGAGIVADSDPMEYEETRAKAGGVRRIRFLSPQRHRVDGGNQFNFAVTVNIPALSARRSRLS